MSLENIGETMLDTNTGETRLDSAVYGETMLDRSFSSQSGSRVILNPGQTIAKDYVVINQIGGGGTQATVYIARREGKQCAIKMYNRGYKPSEDFVKNLKGHSCSYVANLLDYGYEDDTYYEIYEFYGNGTLEERGKCSLSFIKDVVVPNMNEGLHFLHTFGGKGIVHGDIKPSNIFLSNDESHIVIGDFGISSYLDKKGKIIDEIKGTPEYAPRTVSFFGKTTKTPAYDYGALGLVLIKLATGHSLFEGLDMTTITQMWEDGIEVPENIDGRLKRLISGLLVEDEQKRFGYEDVKKWCEGEFVRIKENSIYSKEDFEEQNAEPDPLIFGIFDDRMVTVSSLKELAVAIAENWNHTKRQLKRTTFFEFIAQFDLSLEKDIREYSKLADEDKAVFYTLYRINKNSSLIYKGINYGSAKEFINGLNSEITEDMRAIVNNDLFAFFLEANGYEPAIVDQVRRITKMDNTSPDFVPRMLYFLFNREKQYKINGKTISTIDELVSEVVNMELADIEKMTGDTKLMAWLYSIGYKEDVLKFFKL